MSTPRRYITILVACFAFAMAPVLRAEPRGDDAGLLKAVTLDTLSTHLKTLAADDMEGRAAGGKGGHKAGDYIIEQFRKMGLEPGGDNGTYVQSFELARTEVADSGKLNWTVEADGKRWHKDLKQDEQFEPFRFSGAGKVTGPLVFAGYGITAPKHDYDDYKGLDVKGKIVVILRYVPGEKNPDSPFNTRGINPHATFVRKMANAAKHGAAGLVLLTGPHYHADSADELMAGRTQGYGSKQLPFVQVTWSSAKALFEAAGHDLLAVQKRIDKTIEPASFALPGTEARLEVKLVEKTLTMRNIVGIVPGTDKAVADQAIVLGAHYDHIGMRPVKRRPDEDVIYNGADDNASGAAGMMAVARGFVDAKVRTRRPIVFVAFDAEEIGLVGSDRFVKNLPKGIDQVATMVNLDMIGRSKDGQALVWGMDTSKRFAPLVREANKPVKLKVELLEHSNMSSDNLSFVSRKIPIIAVNTGMHPQLHHVDDEVDRINFTDAERIADLVAGIVRRLGDMDEAPKFAGRGDAPRRRVLLGVSLADGPDGPVISRVVPDSPAAKAGMQQGDVVTEAAGQAMRTMRDLVMAIRRRKPGDKVSFEVKRGDKTLTLKATLGK